MADVTLTSNGNTSIAGLGEPPVSPSGNVGEGAVSPQEGNVSYDTHKRLLGEKKKLQERLEQFESQARLKQEEDLKAQNQYKSLYENALKERESLNNRVTEQETRWNNAIKLENFMGALGGRKIESKYAGFIDLESILLDPETGSVDALSVQREVERICKEYPEIVRGAVPPRGLPNEPPRNPIANQSLKPLTAQERLKASAAFLAKR